MALIPVNSLPSMKAIDDGYMFDTVTDKVLSNKKNGAYEPMKGSNRSGILKYKLKYNPIYPSLCDRFRLIKHEDIKRLALKAEESEPEDNKLVEVIRQATVQSKDPTKGWVIGSLVDGNIQLSISPRIHKTEESVDKEIERLVFHNRGRTFVKLKIESFVKSDLQWF